jgi:outer membrane protein TolC
MLSRGIFLSLLLSSPGWSPASAQEREVTLAEAIHLSERVQPAMVRAAADVRTSNAQRRSALGAYLPRISVSSSGSDFFSEGPARVDPITG